jgi:tellurite resistance protein
MTVLLINAARAFAMVAFADGKLAPIEAKRFASVIARDPAFANAGHAEIAEAWETAAREVHSAESFGMALLAIRSRTTEAADKAVIMRTAQAAVVADGKLELQENKAITSLAEALGLDPEAF